MLKSYIADFISWTLWVLILTKSNKQTWTTQAYKKGELPTIVGGEEWMQGDVYGRAEVKKRNEAEVSKLLNPESKYDDPRNASIGYC